MVEQLTAVGDWCELLFATNIVFEQLVGSLFRSELVMQIAARNGDYITPTIVGTGEHDYDRDLNYTRNLFRLLTRDEEYGESQQGAVRRVAARSGYRAASTAAQRAAADLVAAGRQAVTFAASLDAAKQKFRSLLEELGLDSPKELDQ